MRAKAKLENGNSPNLEQFISGIKSIVHDGEELLKVGVAGVKEKAIAGVRGSDRVVRDYPYQSLGIVFGVGVLLGVVAAAMLRPEHRREEDEY